VRSYDVSSTEVTGPVPGYSCRADRHQALLNQRWRTLQHITASPSKIGDIARAALVLTHFEHGYIT
jgi:hypothetical protein